MVLCSAYVYCGQDFWKKGLILVSDAFFPLRDSDNDLTGLQAASPKGEVGAQLGCRARGIMSKTLRESKQAVQAFPVIFCLFLSLSPLPEKKGFYLLRCFAF